MGRHGRVCRVRTRAAGQQVSRPQACARAARRSGRAVTASGAQPQPLREHEHRGLEDDPAATPEWPDDTDIEVHQYLAHPTHANAIRLGAALHRAGNVWDEGDGGFTPAYVLAALITSYEAAWSPRQLRRMHRLLRSL